VAVQKGKLMKTSLQLRMDQNLTLTPQLQQAIKLLQLSTLDLQHEIQQKIETNPLLEIVSNEENIDESTISEQSNDEEFDDFQWSNLYSTAGKFNQFNEPDYHKEKGTIIDLQEYLTWQLRLTPMSDTDRMIAFSIIEAINHNGFLTVLPTTLHASLCDKNFNVDFDEFEAVRHRIMRFDPISCGSANLSEALLIQVEALPKSTSHYKILKNIIENDLKLLGQHNYRELRKRYSIDEKTLSIIIKCIKKLNPNPGSVINTDRTDYIIPELTLRKKNNTWCVEANHILLPKLSINQHYASLIRDVKSAADSQFLKTNLQEARWFLKSIYNREATLLKIARYLVSYQHNFFDKGEQAMKPLTLNEVAHALDVHESTVSRATTQKYIHTPRGLFELKYFFSSHLPSTDGKDCSSTAIRALIKSLIHKENTKKPLSDNKMVQLLKEQGICVARRTIAKYREMIGIPPSNERKSI